MAILSLLVAAAVLCSAGLLPFVIAADGGFKENCNVWSAQLEGQDLGMYCENKNTAMYGYNWTWIGLENCIGNRAGHLSISRHGRFSGSCHDCSIKRAGPNPTPTLNLTCECVKTDRSKSSSWLDLNDVLHNDDGCMGCFDIWGNKTLAGPPPKITPD